MKDYVETFVRHDAVEEEIQNVEDIQQTTEESDINESEINGDILFG